LSFLLVLVFRFRRHFWLLSMLKTVVLLHIFVEIVIIFLKII